MGNGQGKDGSRADVSLAELCMYEDWSSVTTHLQKCSDLDRSYQGRTALHWAVFRCNFDIVRLLHRTGADVTIKSEDGLTAMEEALNGGTKEHERISKFLRLQQPAKNATTNVTTPTKMMPAQTTSTDFTRSGSDLRQKRQEASSGEHFYMTTDSLSSDKMSQFREIMRMMYVAQVLVFCSSRRDLSRIKEAVLAAGWNSQHCHFMSNLDTDIQRRNVLRILNRCMESHDPCLVVALDLVESDMASINEPIPLVLNYALPRATYLWVDYGARAQKCTRCLSLVHHQEVSNTVAVLQQYLHIKLKPVTLENMNTKLDVALPSPQTARQRSLGNALPETCVTPPANDGAVGCMPTCMR